MRAGVEKGKKMRAVLKYFYELWKKVSTKKKILLFLIFNFCRVIYN